jgi:hypothetical protein
MTEAFDLAEVDPTTNHTRVELKPGQQIALTVKARDAYDLSPNVSEPPSMAGSPRPSQSSTLESRDWNQTTR